MQRRLIRNASCEGVKPSPLAQTPPVLDSHSSPVLPSGCAVQVLPMPGMDLRPSKFQTPAAPPPKELPKPTPQRTVCGPPPPPPPFCISSGSNTGSPLPATPLSPTSLQHPLSTSNTSSPIESPGLQPSMATEPGPSIPAPPPPPKPIAGNRRNSTLGITVSPAIENLQSALHEPSPPPLPPPQQQFTPVNVIQPSFSSPQQSHNSVPISETPLQNGITYQEYSEPLSPQPANEYINNDYEDPSSGMDVNNTAVLNSNEESSHSVYAGMISPEISKEYPSTSFAPIVSPVHEVLPPANNFNNAIKPSLPLYEQPTQVVDLNIKEANNRQSISRRQSLMEQIDSIEIKHQGHEKACAADSQVSTKTNSVEESNSALAKHDYIDQNTKVGNGMDTVQQTAPSINEPAMVKPLKKRLSMNESANLVLPSTVAPIQKEPTSPMQTPIVNKHSIPVQEVPIQQNIYTPPPPVESKPIEQNIYTPPPPVESKPIEQNIYTPPPPVESTPNEQNLHNAPQLTSQLSLTDPIPAKLTEETPFGRALASKESTPIRQFSKKEYTPGRQIRSNSITSSQEILNSMSSFTKQSSVVEPVTPILQRDNTAVENSSMNQTRQQENTIKQLASENKMVSNNSIVKQEHPSTENANQFKQSFTQPNENNFTKQVPVKEAERAQQQMMYNDQSSLNQTQMNATAVRQRQLSNKEPHPVNKSPMKETTIQKTPTLKEDLPAAQIPVRETALLRQSSAIEQSTHSSTKQSIVHERGLQQQPFTQQSTAQQFPAVMKQSSVKEQSPIRQSPIRQPPPKDYPVKQIPRKEPSPIRQPIINNTSPFKPVPIKGTVPQMQPSEVIPVIRATNPNDFIPVRQIPVKEPTPVTQIFAKETTPVRPLAGEVGPHIGSAPQMSNIVKPQPMQVRRMPSPPPVFHNKMRSNISRQTSMPTQESTILTPPGSIDANPLSNGTQTNTNQVGSAATRSPNVSPTTGLIRAPLPWMHSQRRESSAPPEFLANAQRAQQSAQQWLVKQSPHGRQILNQSQGNQTIGRTKLSGPQLLDQSKTQQSQFTQQQQQSQLPQQYQQPQHAQQQQQPQAAQQQYQQSQHAQQQQSQVAQQQQQSQVAQRQHQQSQVAQQQQQSQVAQRQHQQSQVAQQQQQSQVAQQQQQSQVAQQQQYQQLQQAQQQQQSQLAQQQQQSQVAQQQQYQQLQQAHRQQQSQVAQQQQNQQFNQLPQQFQPNQIPQQQPSSKPHLLQQQKSVPPPQVVRPQHKPQQPVSNQQAQTRFQQRQQDHQQKQTIQQTQTNSVTQPKERIIPIQIERDSPPPSSSSGYSSTVTSPPTIQHTGGIERIIPISLDNDTIQNTHVLSNQQKQQVGTYQNNQQQHNISQNSQQGFTRQQQQNRQSFQPFPSVNQSFQPQLPNSAPVSLAPNPQSMFPPPSFSASTMNDAGNNSGAFMPYNNPTGLQTSSNALEALQQMQQNLAQLNSGLQNAFPRVIQQKMSDTLSPRTSISANQSNQQQKTSAITGEVGGLPVQSRSFRVLQNVLDTHDPSDGVDLNGPLEEHAPPEPKKYMGGNIPSRSFRMLQAMTDQDDDVAGPGQSDL